MVVIVFVFYELLMSLRMHISVISGGRQVKFCKRQLRSNLAILLANYGNTRASKVHNVCKSYQMFLNLTFFRKFISIVVIDVVILVNQVNDILLH